ncbi:MAG: restriction endonuclease, partial [Saprospiraceae bacterium]|nr:restriction endonuclease [Saprospiraceae bacterium]
SLALKGKLEFARHISKNVIHKERFYTSHQVYDQNHLIHQILKRAIEIVFELTRNNYLSAIAGRINMSFPEVESNRITLKSFEKIHLSRKTRYYKKALELAHIIIANYSPSIRTGDNKMLALLFDMNSLWEQYVFELLKRGQSKGKYKLSNPSKSLFTNARYSIQPDMLIEFDSGKKLIIDTKWKLPQKHKSSISDLRQIYTYNHFWKAGHGILYRQPRK